MVMMYHPPSTINTVHVVCVMLVGVGASEYPSLPPKRMCTASLLVRRFYKTLKPIYLGDTQYSYAVGKFAK